MNPKSKQILKNWDSRSRLQKPKSGSKTIIILPRYLSLQIPSDWDFASLNDIIKNQNSGFHNRLERSENGDNIVGMVDLYDYQSIDGQEFLRAKFPFKEKNQYELKDGDLLYVEISLVREGVGKTIYVTKKGAGTYFAGNTRRFSVNGKCDPVFLYYVLNLTPFRNSLINRSYTTALTGITVKDYFKTRIPLPDISEQQKISLLLTNVNTMIDLYDKTIGSTQKLKQGLMQTLLTKGIGHKKFKKVKWLFGKKIEIPEEWKIIELDQLVQIRYGLSQPPKLSEEGVKMIRATDIKSGKIIKDKPIKILIDSNMQHKFIFLHSGDIIVVRSGVFTGDVALITPEYEGSIMGYDIVLSPKNKFNSHYLLEYLLSPFVQNYFQSLSARSAQPHLNAEQIGSTLTIIPTLNEQNNIAEIFENIDSKISYLEFKKTHLEILKKGLMQNLLTGKMRVKI